VIAMILAAAALQAQTPPEAAPWPPPEVDLALRTRITQFYQFEVDGKYRQAEQLVAEDTKDLFVGASKPSFYAFQILSITYAADFKGAEVLVVVSRHVPVEGFMGKPVTSKMPSRWKLENGQWCYYVDPKKDLPASPFGVPLPPGMNIPHTAAAPPPAAPLTAAAVPQQPAPVANGMTVPPAVPITTTPGARPLPPMPSKPPIPTVLTVDKNTVQFKSSAASTDQVIITNPTPFTESLMLTDPKVAGLTVKLDRLGLGSRDKATLSIQWNGSAAPPPKAMIIVKVPQTNQLIPVAVTFAK
jgi:hypothetical protein